MIKLGVTACFFYPDLSRSVFGAKTITYLERDMSRYLSRPDVLPILIPDLASPQELKTVLDQMDGFLLQGGSDMAPESYGEKPIGRWLGDRHRDEYELEIMDYAIKNGKPAYGICRGFQVMNAYFGGTLFQDTVTQRPGTPEHRHPELYDQMNHPVELIEGTCLHNLYRDDPNHRVNTVHHQAIKDLGKDLEINAISPGENDGLIEAFTWKGAEPGKVFGVQWHPEFHWNSKTPLLNPETLYDHFLSFIK